jgi:hypothetical protein
MASAARHLDADDRVTSVNDAPDAVDDIATVDEDSSNNVIPVLANDSSRRTR